MKCCFVTIKRHIFKAYLFAIEMAATERSCSACGKLGATARCARCKAAYFCGGDCQRTAYASRKHYGCAAPTPLAAEAPAAKSEAKVADPNVTLASESLTYLTQLVKRVANSGSAANGGHSHSPIDHLPPGSLRELLRPGAFLQHAFPGVNPADLGPELPRSLAQLLEMPSLQEARSAGALRAVERGKAVLASVKAKGAAAGQVMDADTERSLWPQVFGEAFARELQSIVAAPASSSSAAKPGAGAGPGLKASPATAASAAAAGTPSVPVSAAASSPPAAHASSADDVASPFHVLAASNYLREATLASLFAKRTAAAGAAASAAKDAASLHEAAGSTIPGVALQAGPFLDADDADAWRRLALDDCARMGEEPQRWSAPLTAESVAAATIVVAGHSGDDAMPAAVATSTAAARLSLRGASASSYSWLNDGEAEGEFPALSEVLQRLHALPYELNRKVPGTGLLLHKPRPGTALLRRTSVVLTWKLAPSPPSSSASASAAASASGKGKGQGQVIVLGAGVAKSSGAAAASGGAREAAHGDHGEEDAEDEAVLEMPLLPHGPSFLPHAPGAAASGAGAAAGGAGAAAGESGPVLLTVVYAAGRITTALPCEPSAVDASGGGHGASAAGSGVTVKASARLVSEFEAGPGADASLPAAAVDLTAGNQLLLHRTRDVPTRPCLRCKVTVKVPRGSRPGTRTAAAEPAADASPVSLSPSPWPASPLSGSLRVDIYTVCAYVRGPADSALLPPAP